MEAFRVGSHFVTCDLKACKLLISNDIRKSPS